MITTTWQELAALLLTYENDEPHWDEESPAMPEITTDRMQEFLAMEHMGDCVNQPCPCARCWAEEAKFKAQWLLKRMEPQVFDIEEYYPDAPRPR